MIRSIEILSRKKFSNQELWAMHRLRAQVFKDRMGWDVSVIGGMEIDGYDALDPYYMVVRGAGDEIRGCWRLLPTMGPYMLKDTFPELATDRSIPEASNIWELSRFAMVAGEKQSYGFTNFVLHAMQEVVKFAIDNGISSYVTVTTTAIERLLRRTGVEMNRLGSAKQIGVEKAVALEIVISLQTQMAVHVGTKH